MEEHAGRDEPRYSIPLGDLSDYVLLNFPFTRGSNRDRNRARDADLGQRGLN